MMTKKKAKKKTSKKVNQSSRKSGKKSLIEKLQLSKQDLLELYSTMFLSRSLDDAEIRMKKQSKAFFQISGAGHEGILCAAAKTFRPGYDFFIGYYRDRAFCLGWGVTAYEMLCQANGNTGDTASYGRQMPAHWGSKKLNIINKSSCTGTQFLHAVGLAETTKYLEQMGSSEKNLPKFNADETVLVTTGDGTTSQGEFWEALTTACVNKLPIAFLVEDNGYAISVPVSVQTPSGSISKALSHFPGLKIFECDGSCPLESLSATRQAHQWLRDGKGPVLIHAHVTRPYSHSLSDDHSHYRDSSELEEERKADVLETFPQLLKKEKIASEEELQKLRDNVVQALKKDYARAIETPWPSPDTYADHLYSEENSACSESYAVELSAKRTSGDAIPLAAGINQTLKSELQASPVIRVFGEDVADFSQSEKLETDLKGKGGVFKITSGLQRAARPGQVFNSPLAEANIVGRAIGQAIRGLRPVVEIQFFDYIWTAYMQIKNELATLRYRSGGDFSCPVVIRVPTGGYLKGGSIYHSQSGESLFAHIPGLRVAMPSNTADAVGLLRTAIRCDDPVLFLEHKHLYYQGYNRMPYPGDDYTIPFGKARRVKEGSHLTVVCWGALVQKVIDAAKQIESETKKTVEILDLRTIAPFDRESIKTSVQKTGRILVCHEENISFGAAAEIHAFINEECFESLDAPPRRLASKDTPVAYCPGLEEVILPQTIDVAQAIKSIMEY